MPRAVKLDLYSLNEKEFRDIPSDLQIVVGARIWELELAPLKELRIPEVLR